jgi:branched-chain amino acid transport system ATP-binding protein
MIQMHSVVAGYGGGDVLQGVDLDVRQGAITCIVGPNGAGKSTVLRAISGLVKPRLGRITLAGELISGLPPAKVIAGGVVQVPQHGGLFPQLTVHDNMLLGGYLIRRDRARLRRRIEQLAEVFPLIRERSGEKAANLSGGQRRIVEFARALVLEPRVVLLDEPTLGLDPRSSQLVFDSARMMGELGTTVLMVEQNVRFGLKLASHGVVMERGRVLLQDDADALLRRPDMSALFFGSAPAEDPEPEREPVAPQSAAPEEESDNEQKNVVRS